MGHVSLVSLFKRKCSLMSIYLWAWLWWYALFPTDLGILFTRIMIYEASHWQEDNLCWNPWIEPHDLYLECFNHLFFYLPLFVCFIYLYMNKINCCYFCLLAAVLNCKRDLIKGLLELFMNFSKPYVVQYVRANWLWFSSCVEKLKA